MKADEMKIFRLEDRILFEAAAAAEVVDAVQNDPGVNNTADAEDKKSNEIEAVLNAPVENGNTTAGTVVDPADTADIDAQLNALIEGVIPQETQNDPVAVQLHDNGLTVSTGKELVVIDDSVKNIDSILAELSPDQDILILEKDNGLDELNDYLDSQDTVYSAIHFVTHGSKGEISINGDFISSENFDSSEWSKIGEHLTADGDLLFYGCEIAESEDGQTLLEQISAASDADVAASIDRTGLSGNWDLEYTIGNIDTAVLTVDDYSGDLTEKSVSTYTELAKALKDAAANGGEHTITITDNIDFSGQDDEILINFDEATNLTIKSDGKVITGTDGEGIFSFYNADYAVSVSIENIVFTDGGSGSSDAKEYAVYANALTLTIKNSEFNNFDGGAVIFYSSTDTHLKIEHSSFSNNSTTDNNGGAISVNGASQVTISNSYFNGNEAEKGGAVSLEAGSATITNTTFYNNNAENGGAIYMETGTLNISNSTFYQNSATDNGGAISMFDENADAGNSSITDTTFAANTAVGDGGAIYNNKGTLTICNSLLIGERESVLYQDSDGETTVAYSLITSAKAADDGVLTIEKTTSEINAAFTEQEVFGDNTYDTVNHTITPDAFHKAAWCGTAETGAKDQLGHDRNSINDTLDITGKFTVGAVTAQAGLYVIQEDTVATYTGNVIDPENKIVLKYADNTTPVYKTTSVTLSSTPTPIIDAGDYKITPSEAVITGLTATNAIVKYTSGNLTVKPAELSITVSATKTYDGTADKGSSTFTFTVTGSAAAAFKTEWINVDSFTYHSKNVEGIQTATGTISLTSDNFSIKEVQYKGEINKATLVITVADQADVTYGTGVSPTYSSNGLKTNDTITGELAISGVKSTSGNWIVGTHDITQGTLAVNDGNNGNNYELQFSGDTFTVNKLGVTVGGITADNRVYDGTKDVQLNTTGATFTTMVAGDILNVTNTTGTMKDKNAGDKSVDLGTLDLGGADAQNYFVENSQSITVNIAKANLTITVDDQADITYGTAVAPNYTSTVLAPGDTITGELAITGNKSTSGNWIVGTHNITQGTLAVDDGNNGNNYDLQFSGDTFTVNKLGVTVGGITADDRVYDGTKDVQLNTTGATFTTMITGDDLTVTNTTGTMDNKNAGVNKNVTLGELVLGGADAQNYFVAQGSQSSTSVNISKAPLVITVADQADVTYGTLVSPTYSSNGLKENDTITGELAISGEKSTSGRWIVGSHSIEKGTLAVNDGNNGNNYELQFSGDTFTVNKLGVTVGGITADNRDYDGTKDVQLDTSNATFTTMVTGDDLTVTNTTGTMTDKNAGDKSVDLGTLVLGGADAQNYFVNDNSQSSTTVNIGKATLVITVADQADVTYGTGVSPTYSSNGLFANDTITGELAISGEKSTSGYWIAGSHSIEKGTLAVDDGNNGNNYDLQFSGDTFTVNKLGVTVGGITAFNRDYDGTKDVQLDTSNATFTTMITGDSLTVTNTTGTMTDKNAGDKDVELGTLVLGGADAQNYFVNDNSQSRTTVNIGKATLSLNVTVPDSKTYDGTVSVDAKVSADGIIQGDDVVLDLKWEYNSPNVAEADKITNVQYELSGAQAGNYQLPQDIPYSSVDGSITAKDVQVDFVTDAPYIFDGTDQSDSVSATITDVNGNKIDLVIDWNGKTFVEAGSYTVTAELRPADPNYKLVNNTLTLKMFAKTDNAFVVYTDGTASIYSATIPALQGSILAAGNADGSIYTMPWGELIAKAMLSYSRHFDGGDHPGMNYGSDHHELTVTVDTLKFRPMETDNIVRDAFEHLNFRETITKPQALYLGKELFIDSNHPESDYVALFEKRSSTYSPGHEPLYVERDYSADENESMTFSSQMATLFLPGSFAKAENNSAAENYDLPIQSSAVAEKAENMKSDLEKLLDELSHVS